jgi:hypothetical protein
VRLFAAWLDHEGVNGTLGLHSAATRMLWLCSRRSTQMYLSVAIVLVQDLRGSWLRSTFAVQYGQSCHCDSRGSAPDGTHTS